VRELRAAGKAVIAKITRLQVDLKHEAVVQQDGEWELEQLRGDSREKETPLAQLSEARGKLEKKAQSCRGGAQSCRK